MKGRNIQNIVLLLILILISNFFPKFEKYISSKDVLSEIEVLKPTATVLPPQNGQPIQLVSGLVTKVVDGDTIDVFLNGKTEKIRIIGINSPETVDPRRPVECYGKEASAYAKSLLNGKIVTLEPDETQANRDRYSRLLRYVYIEGKTDFGLNMIKEGYAYEYTYDIPYIKQKEYKNAQTEAENKKLGLWGNICR